MTEREKIRDAVFTAQEKTLVDPFYFDITDTDDFLTALREAGYVVVPREPTEEMFHAAGKGLYGYWRPHMNHSIMQAYRAMLSATTPNGGGDE